MSARLFGSLPLIAALAGVVQAVNLFSQDLIFTRTQTEVSFWGRGSYRPEPETMILTRQALDQLLAGAPANPEYLALQANYVAWQGYWAEDFREAQAFGLEALDAQHAALESRPAHRHGWAKMIEYSSRIDSGKPMRQEAQARLTALTALVDPS